MKILHITPSYKPAYVYGGPIESVAKLCEGLVSDGHAIHIYTTTANGDDELPVKPNETIVVDGVPVTYFPRVTKNNSYLSPRLWQRVYATCRDYDLVHIHSWWNLLVIVTAMICHTQGVKVIVSPRGMLSHYIINNSNRRLKKFIHSVSGRKALAKSRFHATSQIEFEECKHLIPDWKGFVIPNLLTLPDLPIQKKKNDIFTLLFLSRIHPKKGIEFILETLPVTHNIVLRIAGTGEPSYIAKLKQKIQALGIEKKVEWIGWKSRAEKFDELMKADLFILISYNENFANSVIEALHMGTPVLISDMVGLAPFVEKERLGWISSLNTNAVADKLQHISHNTEELQRIHAVSRGTVDDAFSEKKLISQYVQQYKSLLSS